jgi:uncharacterized protein (DUF1501 family)
LAAVLLASLVASMLAGEASAVLAPAGLSVGSSASLWPRMAQPAASVVSNNMQGSAARFMQRSM